MKKRLILIIILAIIAIIDASYLTYNAYILKESVNSFNLGLANSKVGFACDINSTFSCSSVFKNDFAWIFGLPFSLYALIFYPIIGIVAYLGLKGKIKNHFKILALISFGGILFNSYLIINEKIIGAYCLLCLICSFIISTIFVISLYSIIKSKNS